MPKSSTPLQTISVQLHLTETNELFSLPDCQSDLTVKKLKSHLELLTGIPLHFQRLHYLDEMDLLDDSKFQDNDIIPGGTVTMRIWRQDGWGHLVAAAARGDTAKAFKWGCVTCSYCEIEAETRSPSSGSTDCRGRMGIDALSKHVPHSKSRLAQLGVTKDYAGTSPYAKILGPQQKKQWVAHRASVALFIASHRGHDGTVQFLLRHGADVHFKTPLGRTALHVAAIMGHCDCIELLLSYGARPLDPDSEGQTALKLANLWGQKQSARVLAQGPRRRPGPARSQRHDGATQGPAAKSPETRVE